ncbi:MAG: AhpC/TSA family protein [Bacteroidales bacterium]|nr:AhpC/TSA family protein [Bacteroidales bacterium]
MKTKLIAAAALGAALLVSACGGNSGKFQIDGRFTGDVEGKTVYLTRAGVEPESRFQPEVIDSTVIRDGKFTFRGTVEEPALMILKYFPDDRRAASDDRGILMHPVVPILVDGGTIRVEAPVDSLTSDFEFYAYGNYDYADVTMSGSRLAGLYQEYQREYSRLGKVTADITGRFNQRYYYQKDATIDYIVSELDKIDAAKADERAFLKDFITRNADNAAGVLALSETAGKFNQAELAALLEMLSPKVKATPLGTAVVERVNVISATADGAKFADVTLVDASDAHHQLSEYLGKGNYTLLEFWASWCGPCRSSIPHLKEVYERYHPQGFDIVSVSMDDKLDAWKKALGEEQMSWTQLACEDGFGEVAKTYNFNGIPHCVLIGPDGEVVETNCRDARLDRQLVKIYGN